MMNEKKNHFYFNKKSGQVNLQLCKVKRPRRKTLKKKKRQSSDAQKDHKVWNTGKEK